VSLDAVLLKAISTFENGCDFTLRFEGERVFLRWGCYGVHFNLVQGARRQLMEWLGPQTDERELIVVSPRTILELKSRLPCRCCGGFIYSVQA
jgi:hypothetical protein